MVALDGQTGAALRAHAQQEAAINYQIAVLSAWHEIDDDLTQYASQQLRRVRLEAVVNDDQRALRLAQTQYVAGTSLYLQVLDAQRSLFAAQQQLTDNITEISTTLVSLYKAKALGGGWESSYPEATSTNLSSLTSAVEPRSPPVD